MLVLLGEGGGLPAMHAGQEAKHLSMRTAAQDLLPPRDLHCHQTGNKLCVCRQRNQGGTGRRFLDLWFWIIPPQDFMHKPAIYISIETIILYQCVNMHKHN